MKNITEKYQVLRELGKGGFGTVYLAKHVHLETLYAIKVLHKEISQDEDLITRFKREAEVLTRMIHLNSTQLRDFGQTSDGLYYMAMDYSPGTSLKEILKNQGAFSPLGMLQIMIPVLEVFEVAHKLGIVHRDIKPENIMIETDEEENPSPKVLDFGIAKLREVSGNKHTTLTKEGCIIGTPLYMSPEQATAEELDHRSDIYSLGIVMYEMLTQYPPFHSQTITNMLLLKITKPIPPLCEVRQDLEIPLALEEAILKTLMVKKEDRFQTVREFRLILEGVRDDLASDCPTCCTPASLPKQIPLEEAPTTQYTPTPPSPKKKSPWLKKIALHLVVFLFLVSHNPPMGNLYISAVIFYGIYRWFRPKKNSSENSTSMDRESTKEKIPKMDDSKV